ncbi:ECF transporter S component [Vallitalea okinawensis]|uniref:ECF transporter S component n=1 Tax=Vallitalea okinawensis TaxID=2078660 RepID=UPI000CFD7AE9|nr:ECF transporter S component [Vallitalea okinawensis]
MNKTKTIIFTALFTAFICVATMVISIPVPFTNGFIHPGDSIIFIAAVLLPLPYAMFAAGAGSMLADLLLGYPHWALPTLIIKAIMALLVHLAMKKAKNSKGSIVTGITLSGIWLAFTGIVSYLLSSNALSSSELLISEIDTVNTMDELMQHLSSIQLQLVAFAIILPVLLLAFLWFIGKKVEFHISIGQVLGMSMAGLWMVFAYYIVASFMYGSFISSILSIPLNLIQFLVGFFIALILLPFISKVAKMYNIN